MDFLKQLLAFTSSDTFNVALLTLFFSGFVGIVIQRAMLLLRQRQREARPGYAERMRQLSANLIRASREVDETLAEMAVATAAQTKALGDLELRIDELSTEESELQSRIDLLKNVPIPALDHFLEATEKTERRSALRDYVLFLAGVVVSIITTLIFQSAFGA